jgi:hypothetical protein
MIDPPGPSLGASTSKSSSSPRGNSNDCDLHCVITVKGLQVPVDKARQSIGLCRQLTPQIFVHGRLGAYVRRV